MMWMGWLAALGRLHLYGHSPRWSALYPGAGVVSLPTYPFEHRRYWLTPARAGDAAGLGRAGEEVLWQAVEEGAVDRVAGLLGLGGAAGVAVGPVVAALRAWRSDLGVRSVVNGLRYRVGWQVVTPRTSPCTRRRWLVVVFEDQLEDAWVSGFSARCGEDVEVLALGAGEIDRDGVGAAGGGGGAVGV